MMNYDDRFDFPKFELPSWSCLEGGKGARRGANGKFYLPPGSKATARMGVMGDDKDPNKPALEPLGAKAKQKAVKPEEGTQAPEKTPLAQFVNKYADAFGMSPGRAAAEIRDLKKMLGGRLPDMDDQYFSEVKQAREQRAANASPQRKGDKAMTPAERRAERQAKRQGRQRKQEIANIQENRLAARIAPERVPSKRGENKTKSRKQEGNLRNDRKKELIRLGFDAETAQALARS